MPKAVKGISLLEIIVVCVIVGILASLGLGSLTGPKEQTAEREAQANLKLIAAGEKVYRMELGGYRGCANTAEVNNFLRLLLPVTNLNWEYKVVTNSPANTTFSARARRTSGPKTGSTVLCINETQENTTACSW